MSRSACGGRPDPATARELFSSPSPGRLIESRGAARDSASVATNGREAVEAIERDDLRPQLVLMDCQMLGMNGYDATRRIRAWEQENGRPRLPIVALTAAAFAEDRERCFAAGMDDFLTKPVDVGQLLACLEKWL